MWLPVNRHIMVFPVPPLVKAAAFFQFERMEEQKPPTYTLCINPGGYQNSAKSDSILAGTENPAPEEIYGRRFAADP
jgi:hypothetical protein